MALTATLQCDIVVIMNDIFSYKRTHQLRKRVGDFMDDKFFDNRANQLRKGVTLIILNMCTCSVGILPSNSDLLFAKTLEWGKWIPAFAGMTIWRKN